MPLAAACGVGAGLPVRRAGPARAGHVLRRLRGRQGAPGRAAALVRGWLRHPRCRPELARPSDATPPRAEWAPVPGLRGQRGRRPGVVAAPAAVGGPATGRELDQRGDPPVVMATADAGQSWEPAAVRLPGLGAVHSLGRPTNEHRLVRHARLRPAAAGLRETAARAGSRQPGPGWRTPAPERAGDDLGQRGAAAGARRRRAGSLSPRRSGSRTMAARTFARPRRSRRQTPATCSC